MFRQAMQLGAGSQHGEQSVAAVVCTQQGPGCALIGTRRRATSSTRCSISGTQSAAVNVLHWSGMPQHRGAFCECPAFSRLLHIKPVRLTCIKACNQQACHSYCQLSHRGAVLADRHCQQLHPHSRVSRSVSALNAHRAAPYCNASARTF